MQEKDLILLDGYYKGQQKKEEKQSKVIGIVEPGTNIFKGIEISCKDCNMEDYAELLTYIHHSYQASQNFTLITGYYDGKKLQYYGLLAPKNELMFAYFDFENKGTRLEGSERVYVNGDYKRSLNRPVNRYHSLVLSSQVLSISCDSEITQCFSCLYELIEAILMRANQNNITWRGIQSAIELINPSQIQNPNTKIKGN